MKLTYIKKSLFIFVLLAVSGYGIFSLAAEKTSSSKNIFIDHDQDGLSDDEEKMYGTDPYNEDTDKDGYKDGAEVKTGYDPLKPAPGDKIQKAQLAGVLSTDAAESNQPSAEPSLTDGSLTLPKPTIPLEKPADLLGAATQLSDSAAQSLANSENSSEEKAANDFESEPNLTKRLANVLASNMIEQDDGTGQLDLTIPSIDKLLTQYIFESQAAEPALPPISDDEFQIQSTNYVGLTSEQRSLAERNSAMRYLTTLSYIVFENAPEGIKSPGDFQRIADKTMMQVNLMAANMNDTSYFQDLASRADRTMQQLRGIEVPARFADLHRQALGVAKYGVQLNSTITPDPSDPVKMLTNLTAIQNVFGMTQSVVTNATMEFGLLGVDVALMNIDL